MRVFVTGATGFIGSAIVRELREAGHHVVGLARGDEAAAALVRAGAAAHRGELSDLDSLKAGARACDGAIHLAFIHDFARYGESVATDRAAVEALVEALAGSGKPLVVTSGTAVAAAGRLATEREPYDPQGPVAGRGATELVVEGAARRGVRSSVVRLPPTVHGAGDRAFVPALIDIARRTGISAYIGEGLNRWPAVHRLDAARLFRLALESAEPGSRLHGAAEEGTAVRAIADAIGGGLGLPARSLDPDEAAAHFGWLASFLAIDNPTASAITRETLGWRPTGPDLLTDLGVGGYFA